MADWNHPVLSDSYSSILTTYLTGRDVDAITLCNTDPSNIPEHAIKYNRVSNKFQERIAGAWVDLNLSVAGGGTGGNTQATARTGLGLGSLAVQNDNAVAITGGTISGVTLPASVITSGTLPLVRGGTGASLSIGAAGTFLRSNGSILQFSNDGSSLTGVGLQVKTQSSGAKTTLTGSFVSVLSVSITPLANTNRIKIDATVNCILEASSFSASSAGQIDLAIYRDSTLVQEFDGVVVNIFNLIAPDGSKQMAPRVGGNVYISAIDSPAVTSGLTYQVRARSGGLSNEIGIVNETGYGAVGSRIILTEIGAN